MKPGDPDWPVPKGPNTTAIMKANGWRDTAPEVAVRSLLHRRGHRFRKRLTIGLSGRRWTQPDAVFTRARVVVFIDGCFWHSCPVHGVRPATNTHYWSPKLDGNMSRDRDTDAQLAALGWRVVRAWEHEHVPAIVDKIERALEESRATG